MTDVFIISHGASEAELSACARAARHAVGERGRVVVRESSEKGAKIGGCEYVRGENVGYGAAINALAVDSRATYMLFLNADTVASADAVERCVRAMEQDPRAAVCGVALKSADGAAQASRMAFPTARDLLPTRLARGKGYACLSQRESGAADWVLGAFMFVRRSAFESVGGFDERFFLYFEEVDLCRRLADSGWRTLYLADVCAVHQGGGARGVSPFSVCHSVGSRVLYSRLHFAPRDAARVARDALIIEPALRFAWAVLKRNDPFASSSAAFRGALMGRRAKL